MKKKGGGGGGAIIDYSRSPTKSPVLDPRVYTTIQDFHKRLHNVTYCFTKHDMDDASTQVYKML